MADNIAIKDGSGASVTIASDDLSGIQYPRQKSTWGPDGTANDTDTANGKPFPVQLRGSDGTDRSNLLPISGTLKTNYGAATAFTKTNANIGASVTVGWN